MIFQNNQHIYIDKKTGQVEIVDENYYMTGHQKIMQKMTQLLWDVTTPYTDASQFEREDGH